LEKSDGTGTRRVRAQSVVAAAGILLISFGLPMALTQYPSPAAKGEIIFRERCAVCHSTTSLAGGQGPGLVAIVGRKAGVLQTFGYTKALRRSGIVWDAATLDRFLTKPSAFVPGTTMPQSISDATERSDVIAYLATLSIRRPVASSRANAAAIASGDTNASAILGWTADAPGKKHHLGLEDLPVPFATPSARNAPDIVDVPAGARPRVPPGFVVERLPYDLDQPRQIRVAPNGDVFVVESSYGRIMVLGDQAADVFADGMKLPFGIAFFPPGDSPSWVYVAETNRVVRFPYQPGDRKARGAPEVVVPRIPEDGHFTRDVAFSPDGARMFVSVGSASNVADAMKKMTSAAAATYDEAHGLGATWDNEERRADVLVLDPDGHSERVFAAGIRNCVSVVAHQADVYCTVNERDGLGDDLVPDYVTRVREGAFYGWPWFYLGAHEDPRRAGERPDLRDRVTVPDVLLASHSAPIGMVFYDGTAFPAEYRGDAFVALHGSWNRAQRTGPKVVRVRMKDGAPTGEYEEFMTGFTVDDQHVWGRPAGVAVANDGSLLVSEDANGVVWRVRYVGPASNSEP
jgi:glucose/arabinose dehydrogenase/cytochrome c2